MMKTTVTNTRYWERKSNGRNERAHESRENLQPSQTYWKHHKTFYISYSIYIDCDSLPIDIDEIATKGQEIETEMEGAGDKEKSQRKRRTQKRERARRNDSIATDRVDDTIASRLKRRRKQLQDDDDDENNQK